MVSGVLSRRVSPRTPRTVWCVCARVVHHADGSSVIPVAAVSSREMALILEYLTENSKQPLKRIERVL
jgi:hypothetical protein